MHAHEHRDATPSRADGMTVRVVEDAAAAGEDAADRIAASGATRPGFVLGVATGSTPRPVWAALAARGLDLSSARAFALDEYRRLPAGHPQSYRAVVEREVVAPLGLDPSRVRVPGDDGDDDGAPERFERDLAAAGGVDVQVLGIGTNGHIAFNEPGSPLDSRTRIAPLAPSTRHANARFFASLDEVPTHCVTQGIGTILEARRLVLLAFGEAKAAAVAAALEGPVTPDVPASALQLHGDVLVLLDRAAASALAGGRPGAPPREER